MKHYFWTGYSGKERQAAIQDLQEVISSYGSIVDVKQFSDLSLTLVIDIDTQKIIPLYEALGKQVELGNWEEAVPPSAKEKTIYLNVSFVKGSGELQVATPDVPG